MAVRFSRSRFSIIEISAGSPSVMTAGMGLTNRPGKFLGRLISPLTGDDNKGTIRSTRTSTGCNTPWLVMEAYNSVKAWSSKNLRGWSGSGCNRNVQVIQFAFFIGDWWLILPTLASFVI